MFLQKVLKPVAQQYLRARPGALGCLQEELYRYSSTQASNQAVNAIMAELPQVYQVAHKALAPMHAKIVDTVAALQPPPNANILDVACGPGDPGCAIAERFPQSKVVCTDLVEQMLDQAREKAKSMGLTNVEFAQQDAMELAQAYEATSQDIVTASLGIMLLPGGAEGAEHTLKQIQSILRPNGYFVGTVWEQLPQLSVMKKTMEDVTGNPVEMPMNPECLNGDNSAPVFEAAGLVAGHELHSSLHELEGKFGNAYEDEKTWKLGMVIFMGQLAEMYQAGDETVFERAKEAWLKNAEHLIVDGELSLKMQYRLFVATPK